MKYVILNYRGKIMKETLNFILSILALVFVTLLTLSLMGIIDLAGLLGGSLYYNILVYGPSFLLGAFALVTFASKSFKLIFFVITVVVLLALIVLIIDPTFLGLIPVV